MRLLVTIVLAVVLLSACDSAKTGLPSGPVLKRTRSDYDAALTNATNTIPYAREFIALFPNVGAYFSYYIGSGDVSKLNMETLLFDRYKFTMSVPISFER